MRLPNSLSKKPTSPSLFATFGPQQLRPEAGAPALAKTHRVGNPINKICVEYANGGNPQTAPPRASHPPMRPTQVAAVWTKHYEKFMSGVNPLWTSAVIVPTA